MSSRARLTEDKNNWSYVTFCAVSMLLELTGERSCANNPAANINACC